MSNPNNNSNNRNELQAQLIVPYISWAPPQFVPAPVSDNGTGFRSQNYQLRSVRRTTARTRNDEPTGINRRYKVRLRFGRRVLALSNESRRSVISALSEALQIAENPPNRPEDDQMSYHIELDETYRGRFNQTVWPPRNRHFSNREEADNNNDNDDDTDSSDSYHPSMYEDNADDNNNENNEIEPRQSESYLSNLINRTASSGRNILSNFFNRRSNHRGRGP